MTAQIKTQPATSVGGLVRTFAILIAIVLAVAWLLNSYKAGRVIPPSEPMSQPLVTHSISIAADRQGYPSVLTFKVEPGHNGGVFITDADGDKLACDAEPKTLEDLSVCQFVETVHVQ